VFNHWLRQISLFLLLKPPSVNAGCDDADLEQPEAMRLIPGAVHAIEGLKMIASTGKGCLMEGK
jgi:hypothetical protein